MTAARQKHLGPLDFTGGPKAPAPGSGMTALRASAISNRLSSFYYPLFEHMNREHGLILTESELVEIVRIAAPLGQNTKVSRCGENVAPSANQSPKL